MDLVFLVLALGAGLLLPRGRALLAVTAIWAVCVAMVGWGPAHSNGVHTDSLGFWLPWAIVLCLGLGLTTLVAYFRTRRRSTATTAGS
jgi:Na+-driven multidrug efflux pump